MTLANDAKAPADSLTISRLFAAPRETLFKAWSSAEHIKRWFSPEHLNVPEAEIDFRPGGVFIVCMRMPDGSEHWMRGAFTEIVAPERLAFDCEVSTGKNGKPGFAVHTIVHFATEGASTRMTVNQSYKIHDPAFRAAVGGANEGWRTTLDKLEREVARELVAAGVARGVFTVERKFKATPAQVFRAFVDPAAKQRWFAGGDDMTIIERTMDVRVGGRERVVNRWANGVTSYFDAIYFDIVADRRLVYAYEMHLDARKISVSLASIEIEPDPAGVRLKVSEQGLFFNGYEDGGSREGGTNYLMDKLVASLTG
ncbi:MAG: polyketide cyclase [Bradyrhizobium sp.]|nr:MAG: polyketide cyclase [Bradyrhizobium sp.]